MSQQGPDWLSWFRQSPRPWIYSCWRSIQWTPDRLQSHCWLFVSLSRLELSWWSSSCSFGISHRSPSWSVSLARTKYWDMLLAGLIAQGCLSVLPKSQRSLQAWFWSLCLILWMCSSHSFHLDYLYSDNQASWSNGDTYTKNRICPRESGGQQWPITRFSYLLWSPNILPTRHHHLSTVESFPWICRWQRCRLLSLGRMSGILLPNKLPSFITMRHMIIFGGLAWSSIMWTSSF